MNNIQALLNNEKNPIYLNKFRQTHNADFSRNHTDGNTLSARGSDILELSKEARAYLNSENKGGQSAGMSLETSQADTDMKPFGQAGGIPDGQDETADKTDDVFPSSERREINANNIGNLSGYTVSELKDFLDDGIITREEYNKEIAKRE